MDRHVVIAENSASGHRLVYVRVIVEGALERGSDVTLALPDGVGASPEFDEHIGKLRDRLALASPPADGRLQSLQVWAGQRGADRLVIPDASRYLLQMGAGRRPREAPHTVALMMRDPRWELADQGGIAGRARLKRLASYVAEKRPIADIVWLREPGCEEPGRHANDPVLLDGPVSQIRSDARGYRRRHSLDEHVFWIGIVGMINAAKQVPLVCRATARLARAHGLPVGFALLGNVGDEPSIIEEVKQIAAANQLPLRLNLTLHSNYEMNVSIAAVDCIVAVYTRTYGPSAALGKAAVLGVRSVGGGSASQILFAQKITGQPGVAASEVEIAEAIAHRMKDRDPTPREHLAGAGQFQEALLT